MSDIAIKVENLSKLYRIGMREQKHETFVGALASWVTAPFTNYKRLRKLTRFDAAVTGQSLPIGGQPSAASVDTDLIWALKGVSLEIGTGEVIGIIGRNGAGKSTLLKILSRITEPTQGRVTVSGRIASLLEVGTGFHGELTGRENIYLNGTILGMTRKEVNRKFDEIVAFSEIEKFIDTPVKHYSNGMYVRLAFAVAAHLEPEILIIDEVLAVGDVGFQKRCLGKMGDVAREGRTVLFVSHQMSAVGALCQRACQLDQGQIIREGKTDEVIFDYLASGSRDYVPEWLWEDPETRPGDAQLSLIALRVLGADGKVKRAYASSMPVSVEFEFDLAYNHPSLFIGLDLFDQNGYMLFRTYHNHANENQTPKLKPGRNRLHCIIPGGLLNSGTYFAKARIGLFMIRWITRDQAEVSFEVKLDHFASGAWGTANSGEFCGVIAPLLEWSAIA